MQVRPLLPAPKNQHLRQEVLVFAYLKRSRRADTACACPPVWIFRFRLRLDENGAHICHVLAEGERDGLAVMGEAEDAVRGEL